MTATTPAAGPLLELDRASIVFGRGDDATVAVDDVSLRLDESPPRIVSIVGESGSGKTTAARALLGLQPPTRGQARWRGRDIYGLDKDGLTRFRRDVQVVFQDPYGIFNPYYRVNRVFDMAIRKFGLASGKGERQELIEEALHAVNLRPADVLGRYPHQLSGGERQRVMLARAWLLRPKVIVADEAVSMLDVAVRATIMNIILDFRDTFGVSTIFITHDLSAAAYLGGDIMVMSLGRVIETGPVERVLRAPQHPYTRLLLQSIPSPDPDKRWTPIAPPAQPIRPELVGARDRCLFVERCPVAIEACWHGRPALVGSESQQAACILCAPETAARVDQRAHQEIAT